jgi:hypothetical protein
MINLQLPPSPPSTTVDSQHTPPSTTGDARRIDPSSTCDAETSSERSFVLHEATRDALLIIGGYVGCLKMQHFASMFN